MRTIFRQMHERTIDRRSIGFSFSLGVRAHNLVALVGVHGYAYEEPDCHWRRICGRQRDCNDVFKRGVRAAGFRPAADDKSCCHKDCRVRALPIPISHEHIDVLTLPREPIVTCSSAQALLRQRSHPRAANIGEQRCHGK